MKRVLTGHYASSDTRWGVTEMSDEDFKDVQESICHLKGKYDFILTLSDEAWRELMVNTKSEIYQIPLDEFAISSDVMIETRKAMSTDRDIAIVLETKMLMLALLNKTNELTDLCGNEFRVLVDAIRCHCADLTKIVNSSKDEIISEAQRVSEKSDFISREKLMSGIDKITSEEHRENSYEKSKKLYIILEAINQPYKSKPSSIESNPTSIN